MPLVSIQQKKKTVNWNLETKREKTPFNTCFRSLSIYMIAFTRMLSRRRQMDANGRHWWTVPIVFTSRGNIWRSIKLSLPGIRPSNSELNVNKITVYHLFIIRDYFKDSFVWQMQRERMANLHLRSPFLKLLSSLDMI